ncbi:transglutaminase family protein [Nocardioides convexus]|uniref:transglutaminase family protein n=1 Tax=Nocardioides convexus TaxID=2712224 RepID=UPI0024181F86|nr:transglutaminase family protein [Nocardioides convexus]
MAEDVARPQGERPGEVEPDLDLVARLDAGVTEPTGWVLPLTTGEEGWTSPVWALRRGRVVLTPGTSAVGLRLPLSSIAWRDPEAPAQPSYLEATDGHVAGLPAVALADPEKSDRTALAFETREGNVHVFLPPTTRFEDYADLLHLVETAAAATGTTVVLEGYPPPPDPRLTQALGDTGPRRGRGQRAAERLLGRACATSPRRSTPRPAGRKLVDGEVRPRRAAHRHRWRQPPHSRRPAARRQPAAAPAGPAGQPDHLLAAASRAVVPLLRPLHRPDQPGTALRRGPARGGLRDGDRLRRGGPARGGR